MFARHERREKSECAGNPYGAGVCETRDFRYAKSLMGRAFARHVTPDAERVRGALFRPVPLFPLRGGSVALLVLLAAAAGALIVTADLGRLAVHRLGGFAFVAIGAYLPLLCRHRPEQLLG